MKIINSKNFEMYSEITFAFSTKIGLNREAPFYFNMSKNVGDDPKLVDENRELFFSSIELKSDQFAFQKQIHTDNISIVTKTGFQGESDSMITDKPNIGLAISTADCTPIFIYDPVQNVIAAIHSGWRSTKERIVKKTLYRLSKDFMSNPNDLIVYIGPSISQNNYEVGSEFIQYFDKKYLQRKNEKYLLDLKSANADMLIDFGVKRENLEICELCTYESDFLHSYRRDGKISGRAFGVITLRE